MSANPVSRAVTNQDGINYLMLRTAMRLYDKMPRDLGDEEIKGLRKQVFKEFELQNLVLASEEARDVIVPQSMVENSIEDIRKRYKDEEEFLQDLDDNGLTQSGFREALLRELKVDTTLERVGSRSIDISEMDVMIYYHMHKDRFVQEEARTARHILITINPDFPENTRDAALSKIKTLRERLSKKPKRFSEQALKHSECPTAMNGGLLGRVPRGELYPELEAALFDMKEGKVSEVIESELGFHLLYCETIHPSGPVSLKEATPKISKHLQDRARRMCQKAWITQLYEKANDANNHKGKAT
jgi:peptidyl-prolyl cis-trans isomerase C